MSSSIHADKKASKAVKGATGDEPRILLNIDGKNLRVTPSELRGSVGDTLLKRCQKDPSRVVAHVNKLSALTDPERFFVLDFLASIDGCGFKLKKAMYKDLLEAVLAGMTSGLDLPTLRKARLAAVEVAALKYSDSLVTACDVIKKRMQELGYTGVKTPDLKQEAQAIRLKLVNASKATRVISAVKAVLPNAPVSDEVIVPGKWLLSQAGIRRVGDDAGAGISAAVLVTEVSRETQHGHELVTVAWNRNEQWQRTTVDRKVIANKNAVLELASHGLPVHSGNAAALVQYLHDYLVENQTRLAATTSSGQMGWQGKDGADGFLWGTTLITASGTVAARGSDTPNGPVGVQFRGADGGDDQLAAGFHSAGTYKGWRAAIERIKSYPRVRLGFYAAFVAPMLRIYGSENFVLDFAGSTSQGKTTTLRVGASVWGRPERGSRVGTALFDWNTTQTWRERAPAVMNNIPLFLDDSKTVRHPDEIAQTIYTFTQGRGRGRGTVAGLAHQVGFESVLISSGERPVVSFGEHGGTRPRVMTLWGSPFGGTSEETGQRVQMINGTLADNYGHAGPKFVEYLLQNRDQWPSYKQRHNLWTRTFATQAGDNPVAGRMAAHFATIVHTSRLVHEALDLPWEWANPIAPLYEELTKETAEADRAAAALRHVMGWAVSHRGNFLHRKSSERDQPHGGWAGRWDRDGEISLPDGSGGSKWEWIGFIPGTLDGILNEGGFEADPILRAWKERGWLKSTPGRNQYKAKFGEDSTWVVAVTRKAVEGAGAA